MHVIQDKVALLMKRRSERGTRNRHKKVLEKFGSYIKKFDQKINFLCDSDETEIRLPFYSLSQLFGIYLVVFALMFFIQRHGVRSGSKSFVS